MSDIDAEDKVLIGGFILAGILLWLLFQKSSQLFAKVNIPQESVQESISSRLFFRKQRLHEPPAELPLTLSKERLKTLVAFRSRG